LNKLFAVGDIHGEYEKLVNVLSKSNFDPLHDKIVFLGDYIDRGPESEKVVKMLYNMKTNFPNNIILIKGNHEDMAYNASVAMQGKTDDVFGYQLYVQNGGYKTIETYDNIDDFHNDAAWLNNLPLIHETDNYIFVHAGINPGKKIKKQTKDDLLWIRDHFLYSNLSNYDKTIVHGHTPTTDRSLFFNDHRINLDTGCGKGGPLTMYDLKEKIEYKS